jgi:hypothetical protein
VLFVHVASNIVRRVDQSSDTSLPVPFQPANLIVKAPAHPLSETFDVVLYLCSGKGLSKASTTG